MYILILLAENTCILIFLYVAPYFKFYLFPTLKKTPYHCPTECWLFKSWSESPEDFKPSPKVEPNLILIYNSIIYLKKIIFFIF